MARITLRRFVLAGIVVVAAATAIQAQSSRITFVNDRLFADGDFDLWKMREDGTFQNQMTDETGQAHRPSITLDGHRIIYDIEGDLLVIPASGGTVVNLTGSGTAPCNQFAIDECFDADAGRRVGTDGSFRIVFSRRYQDPSYSVPITEIWGATVDVALGQLTNFIQYTDITPLNGEQNQPGWCGSQHIVWRRDNEGADYLGVICRLQVNDNGPVGTPTCYFENDGRDDVYPACDYPGDRLAWSRSEEGAYTGYDLCIIDFQDPAAILCKGIHATDETRPSWSPSGTMISFASNKDAPNLLWYDIFSIEADNLPNKTPMNLTLGGPWNDDDPDWGGSVGP